MISARGGGGRRGTPRTVSERDPRKVWLGEGCGSVSDCDPISPCTMQSGMLVSVILREVSSHECRSQPVGGAVSVGMECSFSFMSMRQVGGGNFRLPPWLHWSPACRGLGPFLVLPMWEMFLDRIRAVAIGAFVG